MAEPGSRVVLAKPLPNAALDTGPNPYQPAEMRIACAVYVYFCPFSDLDAALWAQCSTWNVGQR